MKAFAKKIIVEIDEEKSRELEQQETTTKSGLAIPDGRIEKTPRLIAKITSKGTEVSKDLNTGDLVCINSNPDPTWVNRLTKTHAIIVEQQILYVV